MSTMPAAPVIPADMVEGPPPKKRGFLVGLIVGVVLLGGLGAGAWFFVLPKYFGTAHAKPAPEPTVKVTASLGAVVVNLKGEGRRYLRVGVSLGLPDAHDAKEVEEHKSQLLDLLISVFSASDVDTLTSDEGKAQLKETLLARMREDLHMKKVLRVYFTEFVIQ